MQQPNYQREPTADADAAGGPTHQASVQPGAAHLPVRAQPTSFTGERVQVLPLTPERRLIITLPVQRVPEGPWMLRRIML